MNCNKITSLCLFKFLLYFLLPDTWTVIMVKIHLELMTKN